MHEMDRHRLILSSVRDRPVATVSELCALTGASEATIRRDIATLHMQKKLRRLRGGVEALNPPLFSGLAGRPYAVNETQNVAQKRAIARAAVALCEDGESIIVNGGTTTFQMVHALATRHMQVFTNSFTIAEHLLHNSRNTVMLAGGAIYREQNIILSPFEDGIAANLCASRMFMGAQGLGPMGLMESDPLLIQAEAKLMDRAVELVVLADSSKFEKKSSLVLCPLHRIDVVVTDEGVSDRAAAMLAAADVKLIVAGGAGDLQKEAVS